MKKYLYYECCTGDGMRRVEVSRETECFYFVVYGSSETKIPKRIMSVSHDRWSWTDYHTETPEILKKYQDTQTAIKYKRILSNMENIQSIETMQKVIDFAESIGVK